MADLYAYQKSKSRELQEVPFNALIFAAMRRADSYNAAALRAAFPELWEEMQARCDAPGGLIPADPQYRVYEPDPDGPIL